MLATIRNSKQRIYIMISTLKAAAFLLRTRRLFGIVRRLAPVRNLLLLDIFWLWVQHMILSRTHVRSRTTSRNPWCKYVPCPCGWHSSTFQPIYKQYREEDSIVCTTSTTSSIIHVSVEDVGRKFNWRSLHSSMASKWRTSWRTPSISSMCVVLSDRCFDLVVHNHDSLHLWGPQFQQ